MLLHSVNRGEAKPLPAIACLIPMVNNKVTLSSHHIVSYGGKVVDKLCSALLVVFTKLWSPQSSSSLLVSVIAVDA